MKALKTLVASSAMVLFLVVEVVALTVELPKEVSGKELVQIIQSEAIQIPTLRVDVKEDFVYRPDSIVREVNGYHIKFFTEACDTDRSLAISSFIFADRKRSEINFIDWTEDYSCIKNEFEELVGRIYDRLQAQ